MRTQRGGVIQAIPTEVHPGVCSVCCRERTLCAEVFFRSKVYVMCSACRITWEGWWTPAHPPKPEADLQEEPRARMLGRGLRARSPSKHSMPFTF